MRRPSIIPSTSAWLSAGLLFAFQRAFWVGVALVAPWLIEIGDKSPRLGALGWLGVFVSPVVFIALGHGSMHGLLDRYDARKHRGFFPSLWAGCVGWFAMVFASMTASFSLMVIFPPPPREDETHGLAMMQSVLHIASNPKLEVGVYTFLWIAICALLYTLERIARRVPDA